MGKLRPFVRKDSYMPNKKWIPFVIGNGYTTVDGASGPAPEWETVTGNPVSFNAITPFPLKQLSVAFSPVQSLNGYDAPWPAGGGKNLLHLTDATNKAVGTTGVSVTISNGEIAFSGTSVFGGGRTTRLSDYFTLKAGTYIISPSLNTGAYVRGYLNKKSDNTVVGVYSGNAFTIAEDVEVYYGVGIDAGYDYSGVKIKPQVEAGSTITAWVPYSNICPISGWSSLTVEQRGKNLLNNEASVFSNVGLYKICKLNLPTGTNLFMSFEDNDTSVDASSIFFGFVLDDYTSGVLPSGTYKWAKISGATPPTNIDNVNTIGTLCSVICYPATDEALNTFFARYKVTVTVGSSAPAEYTPYNPLSRSISISLGQTVYSGYVDVVTGVLTVDMAKVVYSGQAGAGQVFSSVAKGSSSDENYTVFLLTLANNIYENSSLILSQKALNNIATWYYGNNNQTTHFYKTQAVLLLFIPASVATTVDEFKTYSASNSVEFVLPLAEPIPIQLTPQEVQSLLGENVVWSTANGDLTVEYRSN